MLVSGSANNGTNAGLAYVNSNNTPSNANTNISAQLSNILLRHKPWLLPKNDRIQSVLVVITNIR